MKKYSKLILLSIFVLLTLIEIASDYIDSGIKRLKDRFHDVYINIYSINDKLITLQNEIDDIKNAKN